MRILIVLTSHERNETTGEKTGFRVEDFATAHYLFEEAGVEVVLASPAGGTPAYLRDETEASSVLRRFLDDRNLRASLADTLRLDQIYLEDFDALFYPGGRGTLWDLAINGHSIALIATSAEAGQPMGFVGHGPAALCRVKRKDGTPLVAGRRMTVVPDSEASPSSSLVRDLERQGAFVSCAQGIGPFVVQDGNLITGQNSASVAPAAQCLLKALRSGTRRS